MIEFDVYPWFAMLSSLGILAFSAAHVVDSRASFVHWHDDRAAVEMLIALMWFVAALGLTISASAAFYTDATVAVRAEIRNVGLGLVRGSFLVGAVVLFTIQQRDRRGVA